MTDSLDNTIRDTKIINNRPAIVLVLGVLFGFCLSNISSDLFIIAIALALIVATVLLWRNYSKASLFCLFALLMLCRVYFFQNIVIDFDSSSVFSWTRSLRESLEGNVDSLYGNYSGIVKGLLLGEKHEIPRWLYQIYINNGIIHLFAVSGLHISILCGAILRVLRGTSRWLKASVLVAFLLLYIIITDFSPSTIRAAIMILVVMSAKLARRKSDYLSAFCIALTVTVLIFPDSVSSAGFLLSYGAMYGIFMLAPPISDLLGIKHKGLNNLLASGIAVNVTLLPWFAAFFGEVSATAILATLLIMPIASLLIVFSMLSVVVFFISPAVAFVVAYVPKGMIYAINWLMQLIDVGTLSIKSPNIASITLWFIGIFFLSPYYLPNRKKLPYVGLVLMGLSILMWIVF